jgi:hypothetical protein
MKYKEKSLDLLTPEDTKLLCCMIVFQLQLLLHINFAIQ